MFPLNIKVYEILGAVLIVLAYTAYVYHLGGVGPKAELKAFQTEVIAEGKAAEKVARAHEEHDKQAKEVADANSKKLFADNVDLGKRLRDARSSAGFLPKPAADSTSPSAIVRFNRDDLERALRFLDDGVSQIVTEGDGFRLRLSTAAEWANSIGAK